MTKRKLDDDKQLYSLQNNNLELAFSPSFELRDLRIIELPNDVLTAIQNGESLGKLISSIHPLDMVIYIFIVLIIQLFDRNQRRNYWKRCCYMYWQQDL